MAGECGMERKKVVTYTELEIMDLKGSHVEIPNEAMELIKSFTEFAKSQKNYLSLNTQKSSTSSDHQTNDSWETNESNDSNNKARSERKQTFSFSNKSISNKSVFRQQTTRRGQNKWTDEIKEESIKKPEDDGKEISDKTEEKKITEPEIEELNIIPPFEYKESEKEWCYLDPNGKIQGPFTSSKMIKWYNANYLPHDLKIKSTNDIMYTLLKQQIQTLGYLPFYEQANENPVLPEKPEKLTKTPNQTSFGSQIQQPKPAAQQNGNSNVFVQTLKYSSFQKTPDQSPQKVQSLLKQNPAKKAIKPTGQTSLIEEKKDIHSSVKKMPINSPEKILPPADDLAKMHAKELLIEARQINSSLSNKPLKKEGWSKPKSTIKVALNFQDVMKIEEERSRKEHELQLKLKKKFESLSYAERMALKK